MTISLQVERSSCPRVLCTRLSRWFPPLKQSLRGTARSTNQTEYAVLQAHLIYIRAELETAASWRRKPIRDHRNASGLCRVWNYIFAKSKFAWCLYNPLSRLYMLSYGWLLFHHNQIFQQSFFFFLHLFCTAGRTRSNGSDIFTFCKRGCWAHRVKHLAY